MTSFLLSLGSIEWKKIKRRNSKWCIFVVLLTQLSGFIPFGMNLTLLNPSTPTIEVFINETFKVSNHSFDRKSKI